MESLPSKLKARAQRKSSKRESKKLEISLNAVEALGMLGYANTSLRDIASKCGLSLGMLHYYFENKTQLIVCCVLMYKSRFLEEVSVSMAQAKTRDEIIDKFSEVLSDSIVKDCDLHKLWYDIRNQAFFDPVFQPVVDEIQDGLIALVESLLVSVNAKHEMDSKVVYGMLDGIFLQVVRERLAGVEDEPEKIKSIFQKFLIDIL